MAGATQRIAEDYAQRFPISEVNYYEIAEIISTKT